MRAVITVAALVAAITAGPVAAATFTTTLSGANETVPNTSTATGFGRLVLSADSNFAKIDISWDGLTGPITIAHTHCCALQGANGPVAIDFNPPLIASGSLSRFYDLNLASTYTAGFINNNGGTVAGARAAFLAGLTSGRAYYNLHTAAFPGGEIRGNLTLSAVPEPASWAMMIGGFGLVGASLRRRREAVA
jgi:hypothetical protein